MRGLNTPPSGGGPAATAEPFGVLCKGVWYAEDGDDDDAVVLAADHDDVHDDGNHTKW